MSETASKAAPVPQSRLARSAAIGGTATRIFGSAALSGVTRIALGERPRLQDLLMTPANIQRLTSQLARMRGAAMKLGQLISMDAGDVLPRELTEIMARLRAEADFMPPKQLKQVLNAAWGEGWLKNFESFDVRPIAAASIGQVHRAQTKDGRDLALKVQYPGVRRSVDSDVDNVGSLIKVSGLLPNGFNLSYLLDEAKKQLHQEADYVREAEQLQAFSLHLKDSTEFVVPKFEADFSTDTVLAMEYLDGVAIEKLVDYPQDIRDGVIERMLELALREVFEWRHIQSDPNFANYRFDPDTGGIILLDFGAATELPLWVSDAYFGLIRDGLKGNWETVLAHSLTLGFLNEAMSDAEKEKITDMIMYSFGMLGAPGVFDFGDTRHAEEMRRRGIDLAAEVETVFLPPIETLLVQRKLAGMYLLARQFDARVNLSDKIKAAINL